MGKAVVAYDQIVHNESALKGVFDKDVVQSITKLANSSKTERSKLQKVKENRLSNKISS